MNVQNALSEDDLKRRKKNAKKKKKDEFADEGQKYKVVISKGHHGKEARLFVTEDVALGEVIFQDVPFQCVPSRDLADQVCHGCMAPFTVLTTVRPCSKCQVVAYCSDACLAADRAVHQHECPYIAELPQATAEVEPFLTRLVLRVLIARSVDPKARARYERLIKMPARLHDNEAVPLLRAASKTMLEFLPEHMRIPLEDCVRLSCIVFPGAHWLKSNLDRNTVVGHAMSDVVPAVRHSCRPNAVFSNDGINICLRACEPIKAGSEVVSAQVELFAGRLERQTELRQMKFTECRCLECSTPLEKCRDRFFSGIRCTRKDCQGIFRWPTQAQFDEIVPRPKDNAQAASNEGNAVDNASQRAEAPAASNSDPQPADAASASNAAKPDDANSAAATSNLSISAAAESAVAVPSAEELEQQRRVHALPMACDTCGHTAPFGRISEIEERFHKAYSTVAELVARLEPPHQMRFFIKLLEEYRPLMHRDHALIYLIHVQLILLGTGLQASELVYKYGLQALESLDAQFPRLNEETADVCWHLAESAAVLARQACASTKLLARYRSTAREMYKRCGEIRSVIFGSQHPHTREPLEKSATW
eukprot:TRINITY_DN9238_c0_g1_i1.p1 TRINITY_DN9238_c0_g1~~TRINITY_DN9238_c0_g1_i1.p1  ORF type:complete len:605 (-),score=190.24 TRINITY_DN9238_c0_g1_i1:194-1972(-)